ncbi:hypothetical protein SLEP1_g54904 [Rubroshorea leprosula]|uniref:Uncharacterized protein n=1 Tax=Rubroshorea leprosula TaxID=152421 RepID=A0AAV5MDV0_9ROSI|nr:hypothetical protein SLEP1_g54904 [Rubroshorea leprosula]
MNENTCRSGFLAEPSVILQPDLAQEERKSDGNRTGFPGMCLSIKILTRINRNMPRSHLGIIALRFGPAGAFGVAERVGFGRAGLFMAAGRSGRLGRILPSISEEKGWVFWGLGWDSDMDVFRGRLDWHGTWHWQCEDMEEAIYDDWC